MFKTAKPLFIQCLTPTHVGSGSDLGIVDLPIQREGHTNYPKFEASSLKGALRQRFEEIYPSSSVDDRVKIHLSFGFDPQGEEDTVKNKFEKVEKKKNTEGKDEEIKPFAKEYSGALGFTDARLLFFPIKSMKGVYALVTSVGILEKFIAELELSTLDSTMQGNLTCLDAEVQKMNLESGKCYAVEDKIIKSTVVLEEYAFEVENKTDLAKIAESIKNLSGFEVGKHLVVLHDDDFRDFIELSTEIITRIKIKNSTGVVESGALFTEEYLPTETILYSLVLASPVFQEKTAKFITTENGNNTEKEFRTETDVMVFFTTGLTTANNILQIGGNTTLGKGIVKIKSC